MNDALTIFIYRLISEHLPAEKVKRLAEDLDPDRLLTFDPHLYQYAEKIADLLVPSEDEIQLEALLALNNQTQQDRLQDGMEAITALVKSGQMSEEEAAKIAEDIQEFDGRLPK